MDKKPLRERQMSDVALVERAASWADALLKLESRGPGDLDNAMRRLARKTGVSYATFWKLRYRRPKDVFASVYFSLLAAYEAEHKRQLERLTHELELTRAIAGADCRAVRSAEALVAAANQSEA